MEDLTWIDAYWRAVAAQDAEALKTFFVPDAEIRWHNSNERFTLEAFIRANCEYPGEWDGAVERMERGGDCIITATRVWTRDGGMSFHVTSFFTLEGGKIKALDEYWGDDGPAPQWRRDLGLGAPIT